MFDRKYEKCRFLHKDTKLLLKELKNMFNLLLSIFAACRWLVKNLLSDSSLQKIITDAPSDGPSHHLLHENIRAAAELVRLQSSQERSRLSGGPLTWRRQQSQGVMETWRSRGFRSLHDSEPP